MSNGEYSNLFIVATFTSKSFFGKKSFPVINLYLLTFPDAEQKYIAICPNLSKSY